MTGADDHEEEEEKEGRGSLHFAIRTSKNQIYENRFTYHIDR